MNKVIKKASAIFLSAVMAVSMAVSASAACAHSVTSLTNRRLTDHYSSSHSFNVYNSTGAIIGTQNCAIAYHVYTYDRRCENCGAICGTYSETTTLHTNLNCPNR